jgi:hypothetical protein
MAQKSNISKFMREFISEENRSYKLRIGNTIASSLAGLVCGVIIASIIWYVALKYIIDFIGVCTK